VLLNVRLAGQTILFLNKMTTAYTRYDKGILVKNKKIAGSSII
jgi:hypothetical protein